MKKRSNKYKIGIILPADLITHQPVGGALGFIETILPYLSSDVCIFGISVGRTEDSKSVKLTSNCIFIPIFKYLRSSLIPKRIQALIAYILSRTKILKSKIDVLYIHSPECTLPFLFRNSQIPVVYHQHGSGNPMNRATHKFGRNFVFQSIFSKIQMLIHKKSDLIITIDNQCYQQAIANNVNPDRIFTARNAVDTSIFFPSNIVRKSMRKKFGLTNDQLVIFYAGRLELVKRIHLLIRSGECLKKEGIDFKIFIAGNGTEHNRLETEVNKLKLNNEVFFLGNILHDNLPDYYNMVDVFALPSEWEGIPMVVLESIACGTPVVASNVGGIPEILLSEDCGLLLNNVTPQNIATAFKKFRNKKPDRELVSSYSKEYSTHTIVPKLEKVMLETALKKRREL